MTDTLYIWRMSGSELRALSTDRAGSTIPKHRHDNNEPISWDFVQELPAANVSAFTIRKDAMDLLERQGYCFVAPSEIMQRYG